MKYLPTPSEYSKYWYIDCETDSLTPAKVWVMCASRMDQDEVHSFVGHDAIRGFFKGLQGQEVYYVGHNAVSFDGPVLARLCSGTANLSNIIDTLVLSYLYDPAMPDGHSLGAWGRRLKDPKGDFNDWSCYSQLMDSYCQQDVKLGKRVFKALVQRLLKMGCSELACEIEHEIRDVINEQQDNGWSFDIPGAQALVSTLRAEQASLEGPIRELFPPRLEVAGTYNRRTRKDGEEFATYLRHLQEYPEVRDNLDGTYSTYDWEEFNIGSPTQRVSRLLGLGWEPQSFTPTKTEKWPNGFPKVDEESLVAFAELSGRPEAKAIAEWLVLQGRSTMVEGWLNNVNYDDQRMHGRVMTCGATTRRMIHTQPNSANIPKAKVKVKYGIECRRLWRATPGRLQVGDDAKGLENRMLAEHLGSPEAIELFTVGDPHMVNTRALGFPDEMRDLTVKNGWFAMIYGAQDPKLGRTFRPELQGNAAKEYGVYARQVLWDTIPGLGKFAKAVQQEFKSNNGLLKCIDGGFVRCPSQHAAINYKLQSAGAIIMKKAAILARNEIRRRGLDSFLVGTVHDENQNDSSVGDADETGKVWVQGIRDAGEALNFKTPLDGDYKVGNNWSECH